METLGWDTIEFKGDYRKVRHFVKTKRFKDAVEPLLVGWNFQITKQLVSATHKQLSAGWACIYTVRKDAGYTTDDIAEEVLGEVESWLDSLWKAGKVKKNPE